MKLIYKVEYKDSYIHLGLVVLDSSEQVIYSFEEKKEGEEGITDNGFIALIWALKKIKPLIEQGVIPLEGALKVCVPAQNITKYIQEDVKVPRRYCHLKLELDTVIDYLSFDAEFEYNRKHLSKVKYQNDDFAVHEDTENRALAYFSTLE